MANKDVYIYICMMTCHMILLAHGFSKTHHCRMTETRLRKKSSSAFASCAFAAPLRPRGLRLQ